MILLIDNYDSFVYNLARYVSELNFDYVVKRNDEINLDDIKRIKPSHIIISPGPCTPDQAGISMSLIKHYVSTIPIFGVCLGHQAIAQVYGGMVTRAKNPMHGKASLIHHNHINIFHQVKNPLNVARYHSLIVSDKGFPHELDITARCEKGEIMAIQHRNYHVYGVQFHPESVLTQDGHKMLQNFLSVT